MTTEQQKATAQSVYEKLTHIASWLVVPLVIGILVMSAMT